MATAKPRFTITVDEELLEEIDNHWYENRFPNRTQAVIDLIEKGLKFDKSQNESNNNSDN